MYVGKQQIRIAIVSTLAALLAWCALFFSVSAQSQIEPANLKNVVFSIYPEYDDLIGLGSPTVLVMLDGQIEGVDPPTTIRFLVPTVAIMYSAGSGPRESYVGGPPDRKPSDISGWDEISYELKTDTFVVEYYIPIQTSADKDFSVDFIPLYKVNGFVAQIQQPRQATSFAVVTSDTPVTQKQSTGMGGLAVTDYSYDSLEKAHSVSFSISYNKKSLTLSVDPTDTSKSNSQVPLITLIVVISVIVLGIAGYVWIRSKSHVRPQPGARPAGRFCTECGTELDDSQRFCSNCGTKRRY